MIENSYTFYPILRTDTRAKKPKSYLYIRITVDGQREEFSTHEEWYNERWDKDSKRATGTRPDAKAINAYIESLRVQAIMAKNRLISTNKPVTADAIVRYMAGDSDECKGTLELFRAHNETMSELVQVGDYAKGTYNKYCQTLHHTERFIQHQYGKEELQLRELNYSFIQDFYNYMRIQARCAQNTTMKYLANFKKIVLDAVKRDYIPKDPFLGFKLTRIDGKRKAINKSQLEAVMRKEFLTKRLDRVRDWFVFCCFTGLAYVDIKKLRKSDIVIGLDGKKWIMLERQKTGAPIRMPLLSPALAIVEKYWNHIETQENGMMFPIASNQKVNEYLKEIAGVCGIEEKLTFHVARHTFATTVALKNGVPMETVRILLAHATIKETERYAVVDEEKVAEDMQKLARRLNPEVLHQSLRALGDISSDPKNIQLAKIIQMAMEITMEKVAESLKMAV